VTFSLVLRDNSSIEIGKGSLLSMVWRVFGWRLGIFLRLIGPYEEIMVESIAACRRLSTDVPARTLSVACVAHALHDGYTDLTYVMLPVWQTDFGLSYVALAALRGLYVGALAGLQLTAGKLAERFGT
jgi:hypothetical protein